MRSKGYARKESERTGTVRYFDAEGQLHRDGGPAVEWGDGTKIWYRDGNPHREDGPAVEYRDGTKEWYRHGKLHREGGPAIEYEDGRKEWWVDGKRMTEGKFRILHPEAFATLPAGKKSRTTTLRLV